MTPRVRAPALRPLSDNDFLASLLTARHALTHVPSDSEYTGEARKASYGAPHSYSDCYHPTSVWSVTESECPHDYLQKFFS